MTAWPLKLVGVFNMLLGALIAGISVMMLREDSAADHTSELIWIVIGAFLFLVAIGILLRHGWARVVGIIISLLLVFLVTVFVVRNGFTFQGGREQLKLMMVIAVGLSQLFSLGVLAFGWGRRAPEIDGA